MPPRSLPRIAIVEDDPDLRDSLTEYLQAHGFRAWSVASAEAFYKRLTVAPVDAVVLDIGLPGEDGLSICQYLRAHDVRIGIVFLTARNLRNDRLTGLGAGADAYLVKPVDMDELILLLKRLGQRGGIDPAPSPAAAPEAPWRLTGRDWQLVSPDGRTLKLTAREHRLLGLLIEAKGAVVPKRQLCAELFGPQIRLGDDRLEVMVSRLRKKGRDACGLALPIQTAHAEGYAFGAFARID
jgi:DNA-binding response OmpR family regulator